MTNTTETTTIETALTRYTVIVVDDELNVLQSLRRIFRREPYQLICAGSGAEGLKLLKELANVAVIISDQRMPEMSGSEFLAQSRQIAPDAIRILLTGYSARESTISAMSEGGVSHYISKPWEDKILIQTVRDAVMQHHKLSHM